MNKAISAPFVAELVDTVEKSFDLSQQEGTNNEIWNTENKAYIEAQALKSLFYSEDWVFIIVDLVASKISSHPMQVVRNIVNDRGTITVEPVPEHPLNKLIQQPNEWQDYSQWMYNTTVEVTQMGNGIVWHAPKIGQLITLPAENILLDIDRYGGIRAYSLVTTTDETGFSIDKASLQNFKPDSIAHIRRPNPSSMLWGLSPFIPGRKSVLFNRYSQEYLNAFYQKQATPGMALSLDRAVNEAAALRQLRSFELQYQGRKNQRRTLILPKGVTAQVLTHSLGDQKLLEHIQSNRETILGLLKVPKHELSLQTAGSLGSEEYKIALRNFWEATLKPTMRFIAGTLTKFFQKELGEDHRFEFDISEVEALKDDLHKKATTATAMLQAGLSVNEVRAQIWQLDPSVVSGSDDPFVLAKTSLTPAVEPVTNLAGEAPETKLQPASIKLTSTPEIEEFRNLHLKQILDEEDQAVKTLGTKAIDLLVAMTRSAIDVITAENNKMSLISVKDLPSDKILQRRIQRELDSKYEESWQNDIAKTLTKTVELGYDQQLQAVFNEKDRDQIRALKERDSERRSLLLRARGLESFAEISKTHTERIMTQIRKGAEEGEAIGQIIRRVADALGSKRNLSGRAEVIARTETLTAISVGQAAALDNAKEVIKGLKKAWLTVGDNRVRDSHIALDGDVVDADALFANGLRHPRDLQATDPSEVIQCRCTLLMLPPGTNLEKPKR